MKELIDQQLNIWKVKSFSRREKGKNRYYYFWNCECKNGHYREIREDYLFNANTNHTCWKCPVADAIIENDIVKIPLSNGRYALVDKQNYDSIPELQWRWCVSRSGYAMRNPPKEAGATPVWMHRLICPGVETMDIDHKNGDKLDNRRNNLRIATRTQNNANMRKPVRNGGTSSKYKGVYWSKNAQKWRMQIKVEGRMITKVFTNEEEAAKAYNDLAVRHFGEYAKVNFTEKE